MRYILGRHGGGARVGALGWWDGAANAATRVRGRPSPLWHLRLPRGHDPHTQVKYQHIFYFYEILCKPPVVYIYMNIKRGKKFIFTLYTNLSINTFNYNEQNIIHTTATLSDELLPPWKEVTYYYRICGNFDQKMRASSWCWPDTT